MNITTLDKITSKYQGCEMFKFGDSEKLCNELTSLVRIGRKTATCEALRTFENGNEAMPSVGRIDIALNWDGTAALAVRTLSIEINKFCEVDESFALAEGENEDLEGWRSDHQNYFERNGGFDSDMKLVCERFELVEVFS